MKNRISILILLTLLISCGKTPINGDLDGRWQLMKVEFHTNNEMVEPEFTYFDVNLHLMQLKKIKGNTDRPGAINARFEHTDDSLFIRTIQSNKNAVRQFGLCDTIQHFSVEKLTSKKMIWDSDSSRLEFRKF